MLRKRILALLLAAALTLSLLAGCGGQKQSAAQALLRLLDNQYDNVSVELDPDLEADLRQVLSENAGDDEAAIRAALEKMLGSTITFTRLGDGQQGATSFDLVFFAGTDPDKAAQAAYSQWNTVFANVPEDGKYTAGLAMVETENGVWMLVQATVDKAGSEDKPEPATVTGIAISTLPNTIYYNEGDPFDPDGMVVTVHYSDGSKKTITGITASDKKGVDWTPATIGSNPTTVTVTYGGKTADVTVYLITLTEIKVTKYPDKTEYNVDESFDPTGMEVTAVYSDGHEEPITDHYTIKIGDDIVTSDYSFGTAGDYTLTVTYNGMTSDSVPIHVKDPSGYHKDGITYVVTGPDGLQNLFNAFPDEAASADIILESPVTLDENWKGEDIDFTGTLDGNNNTITLKGDRIQGLFDSVGAYDYGLIYGTVKDLTIVVDGDITGSGSNVGALAGSSIGEISGCDVTINGTITGSGAVGGLVGYNLGVDISNCSVRGGTIIGNGSAGGVVGDNMFGSIIACCSTSEVNFNDCNAGGVVGYNSGTVIACYSTGAVTGTGYHGTAGGVVGDNQDTVKACYSTGAVAITDTTDQNRYVGGIAGLSNGYITACYWSGTVKKNDQETAAGFGNDNGNGSGETTKVTGEITWLTAYGAMNTALQNAGSEWRYNSDGTLTKKT